MISDIVKCVAIKCVAIVAALLLLAILYWVAFTFEDRR